MMITKEGEGPWRDSSWREILRGERFFVERDSSWREILRGQTSPRRECLRGEFSRRMHATHVEPLG
jgi:hypothetical protein